MKYLAWILGLFATAVLLTMASHNPSYVLLVYPPYRIELSLTLFVALLLLGFVSGYGLVRLLLGVWRLPAYVRKYRMERKRGKSRKLLDEELGAFFEGRYADAETAATRAMELGDTSTLHRIIAARSAHELREYKKRDAYLSADEGKSIGDISMRLLTTGKFLLEQRDPHGTLATLQQLRDSGVKGHLGALTLELKAHQQAGHWDDVLNLIYQLEKRDGIDETMASQLRQQAWQGKIRQQKDLNGLTLCLKNMPAEFKRRGRVVAVAARALNQHDGGSLAQQLLTGSLNSQWDSELVALYGDCVSGDALGQIEQAEKWLSLHKQDVGLLLALGKLCLQQKLWGKAQSYLDASNSVAPSHACYTALGQLAERLGKTDQASRYRQQAMALLGG